jgi:hypothetical protein
VTVGHVATAAPRDPIVRTPRGGAREPAPTASALLAGSQRAPCAFTQPATAGKHLTLVIVDKRLIEIIRA